MSVNIISTNNPYVGALSCVDPIIPEVENSFRRQEQKYPLGSILRKSPFFGITVPSSTILPLQALRIPTGQFISLAETVGILSALKLYERDGSIVNFTLFSTHIRTNTTPIFTTPGTLTGSYTFYYLLAIQDPNSCFPGTNMYSAPPSSPPLYYTDPNAQTAFQSLVEGSVSVLTLTSGSTTLTLPLTTSNTQLTNSSAATLSGVPPGLLLVTITVPSTLSNIQPSTTYNVQLSLQTDLLPEDQLGLYGAEQTGII